MIPGQERVLYVKNRWAYAWTLVDKANGSTEGAAFAWIDGQSTDYYYTDDYGYSFRKTQHFPLEDGTGIGEPETDPKKIEALQTLWIAYQQELGGPVFIP